MKKGSSTSVTAFLGLVLWIFCVSASTPLQADKMPDKMKPVTLIFATYDSKTADGGVAVSQFLDNITERTQGKVKFRRYFSSGMVGAKEIFPSITTGVVHLGYTRTMYYPGKFKLSTIDELPFTGYLMDARQKAYMRLVEEFPKLKQEFSKQKLRILSPLQSSAPNLASTKPLLTLADWKNTKIRAGGTGAILVKVWGGAPVNLGLSNVYEGLSRGMIDGAYGFPATTMIAFGFHEVADYFVDTGTGALGMLTLVINQKTYHKLPPAVQTVFDEEAQALGENYPKVRMAGMRKAIPKALAAGVNIVSMPAEEQAKMVQLGRAELHAKWISGLVKQGYDETLLQKMLRRMMELYEEYAQDSDFVDFWSLYEKEFM